MGRSTLTTAGQPRGSVEGAGPVLPDEMAELFLRAIDDRAPELVSGLYSVGSLIYGDFHRECSDVDIVSVLSGEPGPTDVTALEAAHAVVSERYPRPHFDAMHVTAADLAGPPHRCPERPATQDSVFAYRSAASPVTWHELADGGIVVRGPTQPAEVADGDRGAEGREVVEGGRLDDDLRPDPGCVAHGQRDHWSIAHRSLPCL